MRLFLASLLLVLGLLPTLEASSSGISSTVSNAVCKVRSSNTLGTGVVISRAGMLVTNAHVISDEELRIFSPKNLTVFCGKSAKNIKVRNIEFINHEKDLALLRLKINAPLQNYLSLSQASKKGDKIAIVGFPSSGEGILNLALTEGKITKIVATTSEITGEELSGLVIDASAGPGSSGSPILLNDRIIGVVFGGVNKNDFVATIGISSTDIQRAINFVRSTKGKELPPKSSCLESNITPNKKCEELANYVWNKGKVQEALSIYDSQCANNLQSSCHKQQKLQAFLLTKLAKSIKNHPIVIAAASSESNMQDIESVQKSGETLWSSLNNLVSPEMKLILAIIILIVFVVLLINFISYIYHRFFYFKDKVLHDIYRDNLQVPEQARKQGQNFVFPDKIKMESEGPRSSIIKRFEKRIGHFEDEIEKLSQKFKTKINEIAQKQSEDTGIKYTRMRIETEFDEYYERLYSLGGYFFCTLSYTLLFTEIVATFAFLQENFFYYMESTKKARELAVIIAALLGLVLFILKKIQYRFYRSITYLYWILFIPSLVGFISSVVFARTGSSSSSDLLQCPWFAVSTLMLAGVGSLLCDFYFAHPNDTKCYKTLVSLRRKQDFLTEAKKKAGDEKVEVEQKNKDEINNKIWLDWFVEGVRCLLNKIFHPQKLMQYVYEIDKKY